MNKKLIIGTFAAALLLAGAFYQHVSAQYYDEYEDYNVPYTPVDPCPGKICGWVDVSNVRAFGVVHPTRNGINFYGTQTTKEHLCQLAGYDRSKGGQEQNRKWSKCNDEYYVTWTGSNWNIYKCDARTYTVSIYCEKDKPNNAPTISWSQAPTAAACDASYKVEAAGADVDGNLTAVSVDKNDSAFAYAGGGNGWEGTSGNPTSDSGPKTVTFTAWSQDSTGAQSAKISHTVSIGSCVAPNREPTGSLSASCAALSGSASDPDAPGQSIGVHFYVDGPAGSGSFAGATNTNGGSYSMALPESLKTGTNRTVYAYAIDTAGGNNPQIGQATVNCSPASAPAPTGFIAVSPSTLPSSGGSVTVSWSVSGASSCTASGDWSGTKGSSGSETKQVSRSSQFDISCTGAGGTWSDSGRVTVAGSLNITDFFISPNSVKEGDGFTIYGVAQWNGVDYIKRHRAYFQGSQGGQWTYAAGPYAVTVVANGYYTAERNPYSMYMGPGSYSVVYEVEDNAGNTDSETRSFTYQGGQQCDTKSHTCSASYTGYEYPQSQSTQTLTVYQSCDISEQQHGALNIPNGTATLQNRAYSDQCPQCWYDTHAYQGTTWHCSRTLSGYDHPHYRSTFPVTYYTSCSISDAEKAALEAQGYVYGYRQRTQETSPGQWTDVHYMSNCDSNTARCTDSNATNYNQTGSCRYNNQTRCTDSNATNYNQIGSCDYSNNNNTDTNTNGGTGNNPGGNGNNGNNGNRPIPGFTITADSSRTPVQFVGGIGGGSEARRIEVNPVNGFNEDVTVTVASIRSRSGGQALPEGVVALYSLDNKPFAGSMSTTQRYNPSVGGGKYIGSEGLIGSSFKLTLSKAVSEPYEVVFNAVSTSGKAATYVLLIEPDVKNPSFKEL
ncbi:MAG: hypothetical protein HZA81_01595 [Candidatus Taylorbacteria bacterium]|nr:hypothetical protein [Candidatus Taylorbacteria bacterium]